MSKYILIIFFSLIGSSAIAGGGWTHDQGSGYLKLSHWFSISDQHFTTTGAIDPNLTTGVMNTSLYGEYGISDRVEAMLYFPFLSYAFANAEISATSGETLVPGESITSVGDTDIGIKYGLVKNKSIVLSTYLWLGLPLGNSSGGTLGNLQTGDGEFNQMLGIVASSGGPVNDFLNMFTSLGVEYNNRNLGYSDELRINFELGGILWDKLILIYKLNNLSSLNNGDTVEENPLGGLFSNNREYLAFTAEVGYNLTNKVGLTANYGGAYSGKLIFANPSYSFGVYYNF